MTRFFQPAHAHVIHRTARVYLIYKTVEHESDPKIVTILNCLRVASPRVQNIESKSARINRTRTKLYKKKIHTAEENGNNCVISNKR